MPPWCESILGLKVEAVQGKQVSLEWTETSGGLWECGTALEFLSPFSLGSFRELEDGQFLHLQSRQDRKDKTIDTTS